MNVSISDELEKLDDLRRRGVISSEEFEIGKQKILGDSGGTSQFNEGRNTTTEIAELDREWELERENYQVVGKYGRRYTPSKSGSFVGGIVVTGFGLFWTVMTFTITGSTRLGGFGLSRLFPLFGIVFIVLGVGSCIRGYGKAQQYEEAQERYRQRRRDLKNRRR